MKLARCVLVASLLVPATLTEPLFAQSESELRQQNQRQEQRIQQLQTDLDAALKKIADLEAQVKALTAQAAPGGGATPPTATPPGGSPPSNPAPGPGAVTPAPTKAPDPLSSYGALLSGMRERFAQDFGGKKVPPEGSSDQDERARRMWREEVERWTNLVNREYRKPTTWHVRILRGELNKRTWLLDLVCVDPATGAELGKPFIVTASTTQTQRVEFGRHGEPPTSMFAMKGTLVPQLVVNPARFEPGTFDTPPFVGPMVEFGFRFNVSSILPQDRPDSQTPTVPGPTNPPANPTPPATPPSTPPATPPSSAP